MKTLTPMRRRNLGLDKTDLFDHWMHQFFGDDASNVDRSETRYLPAANIAETDQHWVVSMELPGMHEKDVVVRISGRQLIVTGERKHEEEKKDKHFHRIESSFGTFERRFELPGNVRIDADSIDARFHKGMLEIQVAKFEPKPMTKISVRSI